MLTAWPDSILMFYLLCGEWSSSVTRLIELCLGCAHGVRTFGSNGADSIVEVSLGLHLIPRQQRREKFLWCTTRGAPCGSAWFDGTETYNKKPGGKCAGADRPRVSTDCRDVATLNPMDCQARTGVMEESHPPRMNERRLIFRHLRPEQ